RLLDSWTSSLHLVLHSWSNSQNLNSAVAWAKVAEGINLAEESDEKQALLSGPLDQPTKDYSSNISGGDYGVMEGTQLASPFQSLTLMTSRTYSSPEEDLRFLEFYRFMGE